MGHLRHHHYLLAWVDIGFAIRGNDDQEKKTRMGVVVVNYELYVPSKLLGNSTAGYFQLRAKIQKPEKICGSPLIA